MNTKDHVYLCMLESPRGVKTHVCLGKKSYLLGWKVMYIDLLGIFARKIMYIESFF